MQKAIITLLLLAACIIQSPACTSFLVGKKASTDGSTFITYNQDSFGMYGSLGLYPAARHPKGTMRRIVDGDTNHFLGYIPEAETTYSVVGNINEHQVSIMETTFGGREELVDTAGTIDYVSLMTIALQRSKTARKAIAVMTTLTQKHGYASSGESFSIADPNEVWILEMIGKGPEEKGTVWVAIRIPDDCIAVHANQSRIHKFNLKDKANVMYSKDVISFARKKGYFKGKDADFSFADAYAPADFSAIRICEARAWSFFNKWVDGMEKYLPYADGKHIKTAETMPLYFKPKTPLSLHDLMVSMRDHFENTPFAIQGDAGAGLYDMPYRPSPLFFTHNGRKYFNERPISTMQTASTMIAQMRRNLPNAIGGILWFGNDDPNMVAYTPVYCCAQRIPACYAPETANDVTFSWESAFWVCNWVANMTYPRYSMLFPSLEKQRDALETAYINNQKNVEQKAIGLYNSNPKEAVTFLTDYSVNCAQDMLKTWKKLGEYMIVKYNDMVVKPESADGKFLLTPDGIAVPPTRPGYSEKAKEMLIRDTGDKYLLEQ